MKPITQLIIILNLLFLSMKVNAKIENYQEDVHELTVFVVPTKYPLDWESPSSIYKTMRKCYLRSMGQKVNYLLGHVALRLNSPLLEENPYYFAQMSLSNKEKTKLVFKEKIGMGIMGATLRGEIEPAKRIQRNLAYYAKRDMVTFITFKISEEAAKRVIEYVDLYTGKSNNGHTTSKYYNGAFWPRYKDEGGACSTFAMSVLDVIHLLEDDYVKVWKIERKIPIELVGGQLNNGHKVKTSAIKNTHLWYEGEGKVNEAYAPYFVYEPNIIFDWIMDKHKHNTSDFQAVTENDIPGLYFNATHIPVDHSAPLFIKRKESNMFIDHHKQQVKSANENKHSKR